MPDIDESELTKAFEKMLPALRAMPAERVQKPRVSLQAAGGLILGTYPLLSPHLAALRALPNTSAVAVDELRDRALAMMRADADYRSTLENESEIAPLLARAADVRRQMLQACDYVSALGKLPASFAESVREGSGNQEIASDLGVLGRLFDRDWATFEPHTPSIKPLVAEAIDLSTRLSAALGRNRADGQQSEAAQLRDRAYTHFLEAYDEVRTGLLYLRSKQGDIDAILPSVFANRRAAKTKTESEPGAGKPTV
jgi:hypothetical protein